MNMKTFFLISIAFCVNFTLSAQNTFSRIIDIDTLNNDSNTANSVAADESGIVIATLDFCGNGTCTDYVKTDLSGNILWIKGLNEYANLKTSLASFANNNFGDGYFIIAGSESTDGVDGGVLQLSTECEEVAWLQFCDDATGVGWHGLRQLPDSSFLAFYGHSNPDNPYVPLLYLDNIDADGSLLSSININYDPNGLVRAYDTCQNGYFMGEVTPNGQIMTQYHGLVQRTDLAGEPLWERTLNNVGESEDSNLWLVTMPNGNVAVSWAKDTIINNDTEAYPNRKSIVCLDGNSGNILWRVFFDEPYFKDIVTIRVAQNGDIIGCGYFNANYQGPASAGWLFRISPQGQLLWERLYYNLQNIHEQWALLDITETPDGGIAATGYVWHTNDQNQGESDAWLLKTDANGCLQGTCGSEVSVGIDAPVPIAPKQAAFGIYHNPANSEALFYLPHNPTDSRLLLYDLNGKQLVNVALSPQQQVGSLDVSQLPNGIYVVVWQQNEHAISSAKLNIIH